jgi:hypothetical protein
MALAVGVAGGTVGMVQRIDENEPDDNEPTENGRRGTASSANTWPGPRWMILTWKHRTALRTRVWMRRLEDDLDRARRRGFRR